MGWPFLGVSQGQEPRCSTACPTRRAAASRVLAAWEAARPPNGAEDLVVTRQLLGSRAPVSILQCWLYTRAPTVRSSPSHHQQPLQNQSAPSRSALPRLLAGTSGTCWQQWMAWLTHVALTTSWHAYLLSMLTLATAGNRCCGAGLHSAPCTHGQTSMGVCADGQAQADRRAHRRAYRQLHQRDSARQDLAWGPRLGVMDAVAGVQRVAPALQPQGGPHHHRADVVRQAHLQPAAQCIQQSLGMGVGVRGDACRFDYI
jgi:hypothetical protein